MGNDTKVRDFQRFLLVLLILSSYLYAGLIIEAYVRQQTEHLTYLITLMLACLGGALWFQTLIIKVRNKE
ncbi:MULTISPECIES: YrhC family protein [Paraliobacillus]|uniref:YrhC family protein n=1 Tax=Paraliobacillus TaxID=200903 RepID=UPI0013006E60|nr:MULTISPECIES: YrhC family protein [Paraliobacillus]